MSAEGKCLRSESVISEISLGILTFRTSSIEHGLCGVNGLPLTPKSVRCVGRFESIKTLRHPSLCQYVYIERDKQERVILVSETYQSSLSHHEDLDEGIMKIMWETLLGLQYLHSQKIVCRCLQPSHILFDTQGRVKIAHYGLFYVTGCNVDVDFLIGSPIFMAPEVYLRPKSDDSSNENYPLDTFDVDPLCDIWSFGTSFLSIFVKDEFPLLKMSKKEIILLYLRLMKHRGNLLNYLEEQHHVKVDAPEPVLNLIRSCLYAVPSLRPSVDELLKSSLFQLCDTIECEDNNNIYDLFDLESRFNRLISSTSCRTRAESSWQEIGNFTPIDILLKHRSLPEIFHWWNLAGGDLHSTLKDFGVYEHTPALLRLPCLIAADGFTYSPGAGQHYRSGLSPTIPLPGNKLQRRVKKLDPRTFFPTITGPNGENYGQYESQSVKSDSGMSAQPKLIKENDVQYQIERMILMDRLLRGYPHLARNLRREAFTDIPPYLRSKIWAALLNVSSRIQERYAAIIESELCEADQQIALDTPRCHQYDELLASGSGQIKLKRIIKSFLLSHKEKTYWQGLDSVAAPFLRLNFDNEALAFGCYESFFTKYLYAFCNTDSDAEMYKYNAIFRQLLCYHYPALGSFMCDNHESVLQQFSVKNFLTMFSHVLPINLIYHLWDSIVASDGSFPMFIGVAFLSQIETDQSITERPDEEVWSIITDAPEMDVERCLQISKSLYCATPASACQNRPVSSSTKQRFEAPGTSSKTFGSTNDNFSMSASYPKKTPLSYEELLACRVPIISGEDVIKMLNLRRTSHGTQSVFIDIRSKKEFKRGCLPDTINLPFTSAFNIQGFLTDPQTESDLLTKYQSLVKVVVSGADHNIAVEFANKLLCLKVRRICILQGGLSILKPFNILLLPNETK